MTIGENSRGFAWGDLIGWKLKQEIRPSEVREMEINLTEADAWAVVCGLLAGINRTEAPEYRKSDIIRRAA